eukprot:CAMPEP_0113627882 /NCGR_PEP_ID=MMETSP0017_2-20120614/14443_1 /TAXON_ID=2856 /ORGANISM="Cylindrotheca closterium" /LENGTH=512 /DNA_ID=CAMNT_0000538159 /DNA_START=62 /DNA_END=1600 /DNA_ORIENTATION=- /assembly_acc=CAM_ASM_000147
MASSFSYQNSHNTGCFQQCFVGEEHASSIPVPTLDVKHDTSSRREMKSTEDFLASEMSKLSVQERSKAMEELHCVGEELKETPDMIQQSLKEFDQVLRERNAPIYSLATSQNRSYVEDPSFRLRFLRANDHNVRESVNQMIGFLSRKETYFGRDKIARDITLDDLDEDDIDILLSGLYHIQNGTDQSGRTVVYFLNHVMSRCTAKTAVRVNYFVFFNILSQMQSVQTKGFVLCYYDMSTPDNLASLPSFGDMLKFMDFVTKVPVRRSGVHLCLKAEPGSLAASSKLFETFVRGLRRRARTRIRLHYGSDIELQYMLKSFGLNLETFPVDSTGKLRQDILNVWFHKYVPNQWNTSLASARHTTSSVPEEEANEGNDQVLASPLDSSSRVQSAAHNSIHRNSPTHNPGTTAESSIEPSPSDVLLGRGHVIQMHPGNIRFREFLREYQEEYNNTPRYKRVKTSTELTRALLGKGIRFLKKTESGGWVESDFTGAEKKVKQLFRSQKKSKKKSEGI